MITLEQYKKALGPKLDGMTDEQILNRMALQERFAKELIPAWKKELAKKDTSTNPLLFKN